MSGVHRELSGLDLLPGVVEGVEVVDVDRSHPLCVGADEANESRLRTEDLIGGLSFGERDAAFI